MEWNSASLSRLVLFLDLLFSPRAKVWDEESLPSRGLAFALRNVIIMKNNVVGKYLSILIL